MPPSLKVLVAHPGMQHAHQLAWALEEAGTLTFFFSGVPVVDSRRQPQDFWRIFGGRLRAVPIAPGKRSHAVVLPLLRRMLGTRLFKPVEVRGCELLVRCHDLWVAHQIPSIKPDLVVCYETSALRTFLAAKEAGAVCVLDAASIHYETGRSWRGQAGRVDDPSVDVRKQKEIDLADAILTCSEFAAETYRSAGIAAAKIFPIPLGTELPTLPIVGKMKGGTLNILFVGSVGRLKGVDILLDVFGDLAQRASPVKLTIIGAVVETDLADRLRSLPNVSHLRFMRQSDLFAEMSRHDCLVLPSRLDSFGMVVAEAMSVGLPAIVSNRVGAKCIIEHHPDAGWIVPCEKAALREQILQLVANPGVLTPAGQAAKLAAAEYSWEAYRRRVSKTIEAIYIRSRRRAV